MRICLSLSRVHARCAGRGCTRQSECWLRNHCAPGVPGTAQTMYDAEMSGWAWPIHRRWFNPPHLVSTSPPRGARLRFRVVPAPGSFNAQSHNRTDEPVPSARRVFFGYREKIQAAFVSLSGPAAPRSAGSGKRRAAATCQLLSPGSSAGQASRPVLPQSNAQ